MTAGELQNIPKSVADLHQNVMGGRKRTMERTVCSFQKLQDRFIASFVTRVCLKVSKLALA